ncbi:hypothetical protein H4R35_000574 [Dimargaris xerosporica]|nr:hypothetical protein H4R35_000574 [Dimargaris xerosporica]
MDAMSCNDSTTVLDTYNTLINRKDFDHLDNHRFDKLITYFKERYQALPSSGSVPAANHQEPTLAPEFTRLAQPNSAAGASRYVWDRPTLQSVVYMICREWFTLGSPNTITRSPPDASESTLPNPRRFAPVLGNWCEQAIVSALCAVDLPQHAIDLLVQQASQDKFPTARTVASILEYYWNQERMDDMARLVDQCYQWNLRHNADTFSLIFPMLWITRGPANAQRFAQLVIPSIKPLALAMYSKALDPLVVRNQKAAVMHLYDQLGPLLSVFQSGTFVKWFKALSHLRMADAAIRLLDVMRLVDQVLTPHALDRALPILLVKEPQHAKALEKYVPVDLADQMPRVSAVMVHVYGQQGLSDAIDPWLQAFLKSSDKHTSAQLSQVLQGLAACQRHNDILAIYNAMLGRNDLAKSEMYSSLTMLVQGQSNGDLAQQIVAGLDFDTIARSPDHTRTVLQFLLAMKRYPQMRRLYKGIRFKLSRCSNAVLNDMAMALVRAGHVDECLALLAQCNKNAEGYDRSRYTWSRLIVGALTSGKAAKFDKVLMALSQQHLAWDATLYNNVIQGLIRFEQADKAPAYFAKMKAAGISPTQSTYAAAVIESCRIKDMAAAEKYLRDAINQGLQPSRHMCNRMYYEYVSQRRLTEAETLLSTVQVAGLPVEEIELDNKVSGLVAGGFYLEAIQAFEQLESQGRVKPARMYQPIAYAWSQLKEPAQAYKMFCRVIDADLPIDGLDLNYIVLGLTEAGMNQEVDNLFPQLQRLINAQDSRIEAAWNVFIYHYGCLRDQQRVDELWAMVMDNRLLPDHASVSLMIDTCYLMNMDRLNDVFDLTKRHHLKLDTNNYTSLVECYCIQRRPDEALRIITQVMPAEKVTPDRKLITHVCRLLGRLQGQAQLEALGHYCRQYGSPLHEWYDEVMAQETRGHAPL